MANINRDYLIVLDVKSSVISEADGLKYYITDEHSKNLFVNLVVKETNRINKYVEVHNPEKYKLELHIVKPNNDIVHPHLQGNLLSVDDAIFAFDLPKEATDRIGTYKCELRVTYQEADGNTITTSNKFRYRVKRSVYNELDTIQNDAQYPIVISLLENLEDIELYEEDRRANELARQLAEEQRQGRFDTLCDDMTESIEALNNKLVDTENRISAKEHAVDTLIADTKTDIDNYKATKDQEIDNYKTAKDIEIDNAITGQDNKIAEAVAKQDSKITEAITRQDNKIDTAIVNQNDRIAVVENNVTVQNSKLDVLENRDTIHELRMADIEAKNTEQDNRLDAIEAIDVAQNSRLDAIEAKNSQQDDRLLDIEKVNKRQDMDLKMLFAESKNNMIDVTEEGNSIYLQNSTVGYTLIDEIQGQTLVNYNKEYDKELILNGNINTQGYSNVTLTEGVDGGLVDVALEGNTLVNVCDQKDPIAITKSYTVETGNHVALQGEYDGKCRPVVTGNTLVNLVAENINKDLTTSSDTGKFVLNYPIKTSIDYTLFFKVSNINSDSNEHVRIAVRGYDTAGGFYATSIDTTAYVNANGIVKFKLNETHDFNSLIIGISASANINSPTFTISNIILLEGDYTDKPIPDYFEGLQSTFEDKVVTQEMVDNGEELAENLGKYKVDYVISKEDGTVGQTKTFYLNSPLLEGDTIEQQGNNVVHVRRYGKVVLDGSDDENLNFNRAMDNSIRFDVPCPNISTSRDYTILCNRFKYAIDNSIDSILNHTSTSMFVIFIDKAKLQTQDVAGFKQWLQQNPTTLVYKLATPQYEVISQNDTIVCDSYAKGHLDVDSVVPIEKIEFKYQGIDNKYLYPSTDYNIQFESDNDGKLEYIILGGKPLFNINVVKGLNKITHTSGDNGYWLDFNGIGFNASNIVVTEATDQEFGYFEGMKSVGECEDLEVVSRNSDGTLSNTQTLTHEPLRAVGYIKDKYVLIDGKWYIERNCGVSNIDNTASNVQLFDLNETHRQFFIFDLITNAISDKNNINCICDKYNAISLANRYTQFGIWVNDANIAFVVDPTIYTSIAVFKEKYLSTPITVVYKLATPTYEPIEYNPFEVYSDITHISNNSTIPCNMTVKNTGFNCLLKPSTTYTVSSNLGLNTVTTPSTLTEDCLRFYDTDTSTITTMNNVTILEGDYTTGKPIPSHFSGIESAFEQEYDEAVGKYKVKIRVRNEDATKENYIEFYIDEPLRGVGNIKDKVYVKNDKVVVERNCGQREYQDGDFGTHLTDKVNTVYQLAEPIYEEVEYNDVKLFIESFKNSTLFYDSNIPVTSKVWYSYSIPLVDTVAQTTDISDQQDQLIIDLATQCAIMEIMLM